MQSIVIVGVVIDLFLWQVFLHTARIDRGPVVSGERFAINLDRVILAESEVDGVLLCLQDFVMSPHFNQRNFFSDSDVAISTESAMISDSIATSVVYEPGATWGPHVVLKWLLTFEHLSIGLWIVEGQPNFQRNSGTRLVVTSHP